MRRAQLPKRLTLIFDGECGFCTRSARWVLALDRAQHIAAVPFQKRGVPEAAGLTRAECERSVWAVTPDGQRWAAAAAANLALAVALRTSWPLIIYRLPLIRQLEDWVYAWVAAHRHRLPGDQPYCEQHPAECEAQTAA